MSELIETKVSDLIVSIQKLSPQDGDTIVIKIGEDGKKQANEIFNILRTHLPEEYLNKKIKILCLPSNTDLSLLTEEELNHLGLCHKGT
jgi:hypothetical protein